MPRPTCRSTLIATLQPNALMKMSILRGNYLSSLALCIVLIPLFVLRLIRADNYDHFTPLLNDLHWLRVPERNLQVVRSGVQLSSWYGDALPTSTRCHSACCWSNVAPSTAVCIVIRSGCQQHVVHRLETEPSRLLDLAHGTVYLSSSPTARRLSPSRNISWLTCSAYLFRAWIRLLSV